MRLWRLSAPFRRNQKIEKNRKSAPPIRGRGAFLWNIVRLSGNRREAAYLEIGGAPRCSAGCNSADSPFSFDVPDGFWPGEASIWRSFCGSLRSNGRRCLARDHRVFAPFLETKNSRLLPEAGAQGRRLRKGRLFWFASGCGVRLLAGPDGWRSHGAHPLQ